MNKKEEIWKDIPNYEGEYQASTLGNIRSIRYNKIINLKPQNNSRGYLYVGVSNNKIIAIHRLVAITFITKLEHQTDVNHKDGDKKNNRIENLEWVTKSDNIKHAISTGLKIMPNTKGELNGKSKLTLSNVNDIRNLFDKGGITISELSEMFCVSKSSIILILQNINWNDINYKSTYNNKNKKKLKVKLLAFKEWIFYNYPNISIEQIKDNDIDIFLDNIL